MVVVLVEVVVVKEKHPRPGIRIPEAFHADKGFPGRILHIMVRSMFIIYGVSQKPQHDIGN